MERREPDVPARQDPSDAAGQPSRRPVVHDKPVDFPVSETAIPQADGVP
jgi:hypothetical protein